jgi:hypothetical protein
MGIAAREFFSVGKPSYPKPLPTILVALMRYVRCTYCLLDIMRISTDSDSTNLCALGIMRVSERASIKVRNEVSPQLETLCRISMSQLQGAPALRRRGLRHDGTGSAAA